MTRIIKATDKEAQDAHRLIGVPVIRTSPNGSPHLVAMVKGGDEKARLERAREVARAAREEHPRDVVSIHGLHSYIESED